MRLGRILGTLPLIVALGTGANEPEPLGRLFFSPPQRSERERQRRDAAAPPPPETRQTINGEVRRSSGKNTRWINGQANHDAYGKAPPVAIGDSYFRPRDEPESLLHGGRIDIRPGPDSR